MRKTLMRKKRIKKAISLYNIECVGKGTNGVCNCK